MEVGARNQLLECAGCHSLYHQECHRPIVTIQEADSNWLCQNCKVRDFYMILTVFVLIRLL